MTETLTTHAALPPTFAGRRLARTATALASSGLLVSMGAVSAAPALAAQATDCTDATTVDATDGGTAAAVQALLDADTAIVCLSGTFSLTAPLTFNHDLTLFGLSAGVLDGGGVTQILAGSDGAALTVQNLTLSNGAGIVELSDVNGGALSVDGDLVIENSVFSDNVSELNGGAIYVGSRGDASVTVTGSTFARNAAGGEFTDETPGFFGGYFGGAIHHNGGYDLTIDDSTFTENTASGLGGAVYGLQVLAESSTFTSNQAGFAGGALYGVFAAGGLESTFVGNSALIGGAVSSYGITAAVGSTFAENSAEAFGGAMASLVLETVSLNSTFVDNEAGVVGGALYGPSGEVVLSTFLDNVAQGDLDALEPVEEFAEAGNSIARISDEGPFVIIGNIFAGSLTTPHLRGVRGGFEEVNGGFIDEGGNVFSTVVSTEVDIDTPAASTLFSQSVTQIFGANPGLADNGGSTETVALVAGSPAIDQVPPFEFELSFDFDFDVVSGLADSGLIDSADLDVLRSAVLPVSAESSLSPSLTLQAAVDEITVDQRNVARTGLADSGAYEYGDAELAATGPDETATSLLGGFAALLVGIGAAFAIGTRRISRVGR